MFRNVASVSLDYSMFKDKNAIFGWTPSGAIIFGNGAVSRVGDEVKKLGARKVVLTTDEGLVKAGVAQKVIDSLEKAGIDVKLFDRCEMDPSVETVEAIAALAKDADLIIGVGGGSSIDPAKAAAILVTNGGNIRDYQGCDKFDKVPLSVVAIPTASGTGAEATPFAVVTDKERKWKMPIGGAANMPALALCDPELTLSLPPHITAATGMDALTHAIEGYTSRCTDPISDALLAQSIKLIANSLRRAVYKGGDDKNARYDMMLGSTLAAMGFTNAALGIAHCMAHPLGAMFHVPHGVGNAICLPVVMQFNMGAWPEKFADIATFFGEDISGMTVAEAAQLGVDCVSDLLEDMPIAPLSSWNVTASDIDILAGEAMKGGDRPNNPRDTTIEDFKELYLQCLELK